MRAESRRREQARGLVWFVGGAHGTGKSTLCRSIATLLGARHVAASELLDYRSEEGDPTGKRAHEPALNQSRIVTALRMVRAQEEPIVLDGHYALLSRDSTIWRVPTNVFLEIGPASLILLEASPDQVHARVSARARGDIPMQVLAALFRAERENATHVSAVLRAPLLTVYDPPDVDGIARFLGGVPINATW